MADEKPVPRFPDQARRLLALREAQPDGLNTSDFARRSRISPGAYSHYENGRNQLTVEAAIKLCVTYDVTTDFLFRGDLRLLPHDLRAQIVQILERSS